MMNIVSISLYYKPIWPGFGTRFSELLVDESVNSNHNVTLYTGRIPKSVQVEKKFRLKKLVEKLPTGSLIINRLWTPDLKHEGIGKRTIAYLSFTVQCFFKILFAKNVDLIMGLYPYPPFFISIILLAKLKKINFILVEADLWPDNLKELGVVKNSILYSIISKLSIWAYNMSDMVIVITDELQQGLKKYFKDYSKLKVLNLATNTEIFKPLTNIKKKYGDIFVVMYSGILSPNYDFDIILNTAKKLSNENILFVISGAGELKTNIEGKIQKLNLKNVIMEEPVKKLDDLIIKLNSADILVMGMNDNLQAKTAHPSKIFEFMACGKPIVCSTTGATKNLIQNSNSGIVVDPGNLEQFAESILRLYNSKDQRQILGNNGLEFIKKNHSLDSFREKLSLLINSCVNTNLSKV
jgi:glycosyltransferase involved in cell wall biosynthesis